MIHTGLYDMQCNSQDCAKNPVWSIHFCVQFPPKLMSDQVRSFMGKVIKTMQSPVCWKDPYFSIPPTVKWFGERVHQTLIRVLGTLDPKKGKNLPSHLRLHYIYATQLMVTTFLPYFLFGRWLRLPIELLFLTASKLETTQTIDKYVTSQNGSADLLHCIQTGCLGISLMACLRPDQNYGQGSLRNTNKGTLEWNRLSTIR